MAGHRLSALVRDPSRAALPAEVEVIQGDLTEADDLRRALNGVDRAFLNMADDNGATFADVAGEVGLQLVVLLSSFTASVPLPSGDANIVAMRYRAGEAALSRAGVPATMLRAAGFDANILLWTGHIHDGVVRAPYLDVPLPIVDPADIAAAAVAALTAEPTRTGAFSITGPAKLSVRDQTAVLSRVLGRDLHVEQISVERAGQEQFPAGTPDIVRTSVLETMSPAAAALELSDDVKRLTGHAPRTFEQWAEAHREAFQ